MLQDHQLVVLGASTSLLTTAFTCVFALVLIVAVLWGAFKIFQGAINLSRGDAGVSDILIGLGIAIAPLILGILLFGFGSGGPAPDSAVVTSQVSGTH